jgi:hypothetical protein
MSKKYVCGIDPGVVNLGFSWLKKNCVNLSSESMLQIYDLTKQNGRFCRLDSKKKFAKSVWFFVKSLSKLLKKTSHVFLELQPDIALPNVFVVVIALEQSILIQFPDIKVVVIPPFTIREFYDTHGSSYDERKQLSLGTHVFEEAEIEKIKRKFLKRGKNGIPIFKVDAVEANLFAVYGFVKIKNYNTSNIEGCHILDVVRGFDMRNVVIIYVYNPLFVECRKVLNKRICFIITLMLLYPDVEVCEISSVGVDSSQEICCVCGINFSFIRSDSSVAKRAMRGKVCFGKLELVVNVNIPNSTVYI